MSVLDSKPVSHVEVEVIYSHNTIQLEVSTVDNEPIDTRGSLVQTVVCQCKCVGCLPLWKKTKWRFDRAACHFKTHIYRHSVRLSVPVRLGILISRRFGSTFRRPFPLNSSPIHRQRMRGGGLWESLKSSVILKGRI